MSNKNRFSNITINLYISNKINESLETIFLALIGLEINKTDHLRIWVLANDSSFLMSLHWLLSGENYDTK